MSRPRVDPRPGLAEQSRRLRTAYEWSDYRSLDELAADFPDMEATSIRNTLNGHRAAKEMELEKFADLFGVPLAFLLGDTDSFTEQASTQADLPEDQPDAYDLLVKLDQEVEQIRKYLEEDSRRKMSEAARGEKQGPPPASKSSRRRPA